MKNKFKNILILFITTIFFFSMVNASIAAGRPKKFIRVMAAASLRDPFN